jgi:hypothetical protein
LDYALVYELNRSVSKVDYLSGFAEENSCRLGSEYLSKLIEGAP